jgi:hypothetical protein
MSLDGSNFFYGTSENHIFTSAIYLRPIVFPTGTKNRRRFFFIAQ